ncbi:MAG: 1,4-dihydroxy-6-naphthoate synthase [Bacteroidota bacterium]|nr:1,4-dihydroxy-6-naphthoate synthase [Bacteroidota bacterium]
MKLTLGYSSCPNDTFIFDAAVHHKIDTENLEFDLLIADVEELNKKALSGKIDMTKLSYHAYALVNNNYKLLRAGGALGKNNGPLLISSKAIHPENLKNSTIAIPGRHTTANLLLHIAYPEATMRKEYLFSEIENAVLSDEVDCGLIIHENRFTYQDKGLKKIADLGEFWEQKTGLPIPLGGIAVKRTIAEDVQKKINRVIARSIKFAYDNPDSASEYIKAHAQEMNPEVMKKHIDLYVNNYSYDVGEEGEKAVKALLEAGQKTGLFSIPGKSIFIQEN